MQSLLGRRELVLRPLARVGGSLGSCPTGEHKQTWALDHAPSQAVVAGRVLAVSPLPQMCGGHGPAPCFPQPTRSPLYDLIVAWLQLLSQIYVPDSRCTHPTPTHFPLPPNFDRTMLTWASSAAPTCYSSRILYRRQEHPAVCGHVPPLSTPSSNPAPSLVGLAHKCHKLHQGLCSS